MSKGCHEKARTQNTAQRKAAKTDLRAPLRSCDQKTACNICGIGERTYHEWKERGHNGEEPYTSFFSAASRARDTHKARLLKIVIDAADKDARHAEWLLEKGWPREFGRDVILVQEPPVCEPTPVIANIRRDAESERAVKLFGERPKPSI